MCELFSGNCWHCRAKICQDRLRPILLSTHYSVVAFVRGRRRCTRYTGGLQGVIFRNISDGRKGTEPKQELAEEQEAANERLTKRMKLDKALTFKKKSHEKQYCFNETVKDKIQEARTALNQSTPALEKAKSALTESEKLIDGR